MTARTALLLIISIVIGCSGYLWYTRRPKSTTLPRLEGHTLRHLGIVMDGNRRWAKKKGLAAWLGHQKGTDPVRLSVEFCIEQNIPHLSLYALSLENLKRPQEELDHLFDIIEKSLTSDDFETLVRHGVKINLIGDRSKFPERLRPVLADIEQKTENGTALTLNILFCYGGQQEIVAAAQALARMTHKGALSPDAITPTLFEEQLWLKDSPAADLIIRTGGCNRLSNFLTWHSAYSELMFTTTYWPDITKQDLHDAVVQFMDIKRNFGT